MYPYVWNDTRTREVLENDGDWHFIGAQREPRVRALICSRLESFDRSTGVCASTAVRHAWTSRPGRRDVCVGEGQGTFQGVFSAEDGDGES